MRNVKIEDSIRKPCPQAVLGLLQCRVTVGADSEDFLTLFHEKISELSAVALAQANKRERIQTTRAAYKALGKDPNRYRCSAEAMCRRIAKERGLYYINNVVDINNYLSIKSGYSMGTYDLADVQGEICWRQAAEGTVYQGIGKDAVNIAQLPVLFDDMGPFGNPTSDSTRAMITEKTQEILMVFYAFDGDTALAQLLQEAEVLLRKFAAATEIEKYILR